MSRIKGRKSKYLKGLENDPYWQEVRRKIKLRDNFTCQATGKRINLSVHHITYFVRVNGQKIDIRGRELEFLEWLILLNQEFHNYVHSNNSHALNPKNAEKINAIEFKKLNPL